MSDLFGAPPPPAPAKPVRQRRAPSAATPAEKPEIATPAPAPIAPPAPAAPRLYGTVTLHDGRQVDSSSAEWRRECLARYLLRLALGERDDWLHGFGAEEAELRAVMRALRATQRGTR